MTLPNVNAEFEALLDYLKRSRGFDFTGYKRASLVRRVDKQMQAAGVESYADYVNVLEANPEEITRLLSTLLINVTNFFRDAPVWELMQSDIIPQILASRPPEQPLRVWSAGGATGEEAFTLAILLAEALGMDEFRNRVKIYATDIDEDALNQARQAVFTPPQVAEVPPALLSKYFDQSGDRYALHKDLRRAVIFGRHNLVHDVPISRLDILVCRNTLMYFNAELQSRILARFHFALNDGGFLILGKAETLLINSHLFAQVDLKRRVFSKVPNGNGGRGRMAYASPANGEEGVSHTGLPPRLPELALDTSPVAQVVVDNQGLLALANERARSLFRLTPRDMQRPFYELELSYRPVELRAFIDKVNAERYPVMLKEILFRGSEGEITFYDVQLVPLASVQADAQGVSITFQDVTRYKRLQEELEASNRELSAAYEEAQSAAEELETTNEELQASAEELETTNEELQSTNEEMETMNEELQSANEELQTMNEELRQRSMELTEISEFTEAILSSLWGGVAVIDADMRVQKWNIQAEEMWGLRNAEVEGKNFMGLDIGLPVEMLIPQIRACLSGISRGETVTLDANNRRGRAIRCKVNTTPLIDRSQNIRGVILIMQDVESGAMPAMPDQDGRTDGAVHGADGHDGQYANSDAHYADGNDHQADGDGHHAGDIRNAPTATPAGKAKPVRGARSNNV